MKGVRVFSAKALLREIMRIAVVIDLTAQNLLIHLKHVFFAPARRVSRLGQTRCHEGFLFAHALTRTLSRGRGSVAVGSTTTTAFLRGLVVSSTLVGPILFAAVLVSWFLFLLAAGSVAFFRALVLPFFDPSLQLADKWTDCIVWSGKLIQRIPCNFRHFLATFRCKGKILGHTTTHITGASFSTVRFLIGQGVLFLERVVPRQGLTRRVGHN
mmetsp:Transcript_2772/g.5880  ORF Transcript_2772/g.5880 Transcript_2772/m.5880 type:complete len:213 (+) Transcript_2772:400-1038(+)